MKMESGQQLITKELVEADAAAFELAQRKAAIYAKSDLVPQQYRNNIGNVLIAENMSRRMGADLLMVMQNLFVVHGTPGWSAKFLIACFNSCGRFSAIKYRFVGQRGQPEWGCVAYAMELATGDIVEGTEVTMAMAKAEMWSEKKGSKWLTMPEQMLRYRAATFFIRTTAPEIGMGLMTKEEIEDTVIDGTATVRNGRASRLDSLTDRLSKSTELVDQSIELTTDEPTIKPFADRLQNLTTVQAVIDAMNDEHERIETVDGDDATRLAEHDAANEAAESRIAEISIAEIKAARGERSNKSEATA